MSTGHEGSMVTVHSRSVEETVGRMVTLALQAHTGTEGTLRDRCIRAFEVIVYLERRDGRRVVADIGSP